jgi:hypothetical protein
MKGGVTSGVVYPRAIERISRAFRFRNIGGASAGAIAAAAAAAAELGRQRGVPGRFETLAGLPNALGQSAPGDDRTMLFRFFQPQESTSAVFHTCAAALGGWTGAWLRVPLAACRSFWRAALAGALPGATVLAVALTEPRPGAAIVLAVLALAAIVLGAMLGAAGAFVWDVVHELPRNFFGLATGMKGDAPTAAEALTPWLAAYLNELAGASAGAPALTFGDLHGADINLEMMTTSLTHGRPYRVPFRDDVTHENRQFFFRREDFEKLFPHDVVQWMVDHPRASADDHGSAAQQFAKDGFLPLPEPDDLPVVVAVRLSLSFPVLLSAVPLYAVDYSRKDPADRVPERCWFSDGGISSNFPIHFFDTLLPRWPTFGIDLTEKHPDYPAGFYMPCQNSAGTLVKWQRFDSRPSPFERLAGFLGCIVMTAKDWADNAQCRLPGFRDRIAQISLELREGGLNLTMPPDLIKKLADFGEEAGKAFVDRFSGEPTPNCDLNWPNHRRLRMRSGLAAVSEVLAALKLSCAETETQPGDTGYVAMVESEAAPSYPWCNERQQRHAIALVQDLLGMAQRVLDTGSADVGYEAPRPRPELRMRPRV